MAEVLTFNGGIRDVWVNNLEDEFRIIRQVVQKYKYVAMDTEFPGVVARPMMRQYMPDYAYQMLRCNVNVLNIIQLGMTFMDENGRTPGPCYHAFQFNFKFDLEDEIYARESIDLLRNSGLQFHRHKHEGIEPSAFAELLMSSGAVLMDNIKWLGFHSGFDFGYLIKLLTNQQLPPRRDEFADLLKLYFPGGMYDIKYIIQQRCGALRGGLQNVAEQLQVERVGQQHQAGSDALLTGMSFFKIKERFFGGTIDDSQFLGRVFDLEGNSNYFRT